MAIEWEISTPLLSEIEAGFGRSLVLTTPTTPYGKSSDSGHGISLYRNYDNDGKEARELKITERKPI